MNKSHPKNLSGSGRLSATFWFGNFSLWY